jgi:hypothetical protein
MNEIGILAKQNLEKIVNHSKQNSGSNKVIQNYFVYEPLTIPEFIIITPDTDSEDTGQML